MQKYTLLTLIIGLALITQGQPNFPDEGDIYNTSIMPRVDIEISEDTLQWLYENVQSDYEFKARFIFTTDVSIDTVEDVGFRLRGNTSRSSAKKSFKVSFNTYESGRKFHGVEKMNLNGEHNDPSIIRSHLSWNIFEQMRVPSPRSNHVDLFINKRFYGLYINVEHIDEEFIESRYNNNYGNLYKCLYPADLTYLGTNKDDYKNNGYELKINTDKDDYSDLINFTKTLQNTTSANMPNDIEPIFNMNGFLRYLAAEVFTGHWDAYSVNKNNYYLYNNSFTGKFEFVPYDTDNTFGIDWFGIDWATRDIYRWWHDDQDRPLTSKTFGNQVYKDRFSFFLNELINDYTNTNNLFPKIDSIFNKIKSSANADDYRTMDYGWSYNDFVNSYTQDLGAHVKYGLKPFITQRINSINNQIVLNPIAPIIENVYNNYPLLSEDINIKADITDDELNYTATLNYKVSDGDWQSKLMNSQGGILYKVTVPAIAEAGIVSYYIESTDASNKTTREPYSGEYSINIGVSNVKLVINEFMASNSNSIIDNYGETDDWLEIYNAGNETINLSGKYLTDDLTTKDKWSFPNVTVEPGDYYIVWTDDDTEQGDNHANFKLSKSGESIGIFDSFETGFAAIDMLTYGEQTTDYSSGVSADGSILTQNFITPAGENESVNLSYITITYNMNKQISDGNFIKDIDFIDIAGTFNGWQGDIKIYDSDSDGLHSATLFGFANNEEIEYKARINADWSGGEFPEMGGDGNRVYITTGGENVLSHWFNDETTSVDGYFEPLSISVYPNPVKSEPINIVSNQTINSVEIFNTAGMLIKSISGSNSNNLSISHNLSKGIYIIKTSTDNQELISKIIVY